VPSGSCHVVVRDGPRTIDAKEKDGFQTQRVTGVEGKSEACKGWEWKYCHAKPSRQ